MTLQLLHSGFPYISGKFDILFYQCVLKLMPRVFGKVLAHLQANENTENKIFSEKKAHTYSDWEQTL
jgi:hypothetical protein